MWRKIHELNTFIESLSCYKRKILLCLNKMFVYFSIISNFRKNQTEKKKQTKIKQILPWKYKTKKAAELIPKEKNLNSKIYLTWTQRITNPTLRSWWWWWQIHIGEMNSKIIQMCNCQRPTILSNFNLYASPEKKKLLMIPILSSRLLLDHKIP